MSGKFNAARLLRELREARGQSLRTVAEDIGVAPSQLSRLERGERGYNEEIGKRLAGYYDVPVETLALQQGRVPDDVVEILMRHPEEIDRIRQRYGLRTTGDQHDDERAPSD